MEKMGTENIVKTRKKRVERISNTEIVECYKYYFQDLPEKLIKRHIISLKRISESHVFYRRTSKKHIYSKSELVFIDSLNLMPYPALMKKHKLSRRGVANAIYESRKALIDGIKRDIASGLLK